MAKPRAAEKLDEVIATADILENELNKNRVKEDEMIADYKAVSKKDDTTSKELVKVADDYNQLGRDFNYTTNSAVHLLEDHPNRDLKFIENAKYFSARTRKKSGREADNVTPTATSTTATTRKTQLARISTSSA
ncbi:hypothetical protein PR003_g7442 [Phytophthora rubi]|uniref:Uncharacterized protein n=1 Tax=Phytophthora rubi TaxID=129364 RepID=A0A6A3LGN2_9STRA|nr:hypothetical protein PR002_g13485 [Phytophthora rubi]KAE9039919.1 hypothetical protein PR001_g7306 [Phytophthora rubi]KAE9346415.1 hypothetical protein PR003_g7442 [Phytophthora rubi]